MKKTKGMFIAVFVVLNLITTTLFFGCASDSVESASKCYKVRLGRTYCYPPSYTVVGYFDESNPYTTAHYDEDGKPSYYSAAISNFPKSLHKIDSVVYLKFHYDEVKDQEYKRNPCNFNEELLKYLILDEIYTQSCNSIKKPE